MYSFLFDRKSLILLVSGLATAGCLLFFAGLLTGVSWGVPHGEEVTTAPPPRAAVAAAFPPSEPCAPLAAPATDPQEGVEAAPVVPESTFDEPVPMLEAEAHSQRPPELNSEGRRAALQPLDEPAPIERGERQEPTALPAAPSNPSFAPATTTALAKASPPSAPQAEAVPVEAAAPVYSLQIGAFRQPENSDRIVRELQSRGYDAYVVREGTEKAIQTVRIGRFLARDEALRAALDFRKREGKPVIVRPIGLGAVRLTSW